MNINDVTEPLLVELMKLNKNNPSCHLRIGTHWRACYGVTYDLQHPDFYAKCVCPARVYIKTEDTHLKLVFTNLDRRRNRRLYYRDFGDDFYGLAVKINTLIPEVLHAHLKDFGERSKMEKARYKRRCREEKAV
jgi:hypothetical protein